MDKFWIVTCKPLGGSQSRVRVSTYPRLHTSYEEALIEAKRLAELPGNLRSRFFVMESKSVAQVQEPKATVAPLS